MVKLESLKKYEIVFKKVSDDVNIEPLWHSFENDKLEEKCDKLSLKKKIVQLKKVKSISTGAQLNFGEPSIQYFVDKKTESEQESVIDVTNYLDNNKHEIEDLNSILKILKVRSENNQVNLHGTSKNYFTVNSQENKKNCASQAEMVNAIRNEYRKNNIKEPKSGNETFMNSYSKDTNSDYTFVDSQGNLLLFTTEDEIKQHLLDAYMSAHNKNENRNNIYQNKRERENVYLNENSLLKMLDSRYSNKKKNVDNIPFGYNRNVNPTLVMVVEYCKYCKKIGTPEKSTQSDTENDEKLISTKSSISCGNNTKPRLNSKICKCKRHKNKKRTASFNRSKQKCKKESCRLRKDMKNDELVISTKSSISGESNTEPTLHSKNCKCRKHKNMAIRDNFNKSKLKSKNESCHSIKGPYKVPSHQDQINESCPSREETKNDEIAITTKSSISSLSNTEPNLSSMKCECKKHKKMEILDKKNNRSKSKCMNEACHSKKESYKEPSQHDQINKSYPSRKAAENNEIVLARKSSISCRSNTEPILNSTKCECKKHKKIEIFDSFNRSTSKCMNESCHSKKETYKEPSRHHLMNESCPSRKKIVNDEIVLSRKSSISCRSNTEPSLNSSKCKYEIPKKKEIFDNFNQSKSNCVNESCHSRKETYKEPSCHDIISKSKSETCNACKYIKRQLSYFNPMSKPCHEETCNFKQNLQECTLCDDEGETNVTEKICNKESCSLKNNPSKVKKSCYNESENQNETRNVSRPYHHNRPRLMQNDNIRFLKRKSKCSCTSIKESKIKPCNKESVHDKISTCSARRPVERRRSSGTCTRIKEPKIEPINKKSVHGKKCTCHARNVVRPTISTSKSDLKKTSSHVEIEIKIDTLDDTYIDTIATQTTFGSKTDTNQDNMTQTDYKTYFKPQSVRNIDQTTSTCVERKTADVQTEGKHGSRFERSYQSSRESIDNNIVSSMIQKLQKNHQDRCSCTRGGCMYNINTLTFPLNSLEKNNSRKNESMNNLIREIVVKENEENVRLLEKFKRHTLEQKESIEKLKKLVMSQKNRPNKT